MVPGLAGAGISFQSVNFPDSYLRHSNGQVILQSNDGSSIFREDATFYVRKGLADATKVSFESYNYPGNYIRHRNYLLYSETVTVGTGYNDATFIIGDQIVAPAVSLTSPTDNSTYTAPGTINLVASASVNYGTINKVEFYNGTSLIGTEYVSPYTYAWKNVTAGTYTITAKATDNKGVSSTSATRKITVKNSVNQLPSVSITGPANSAIYIAPASIIIAASASDNDGTIAKVEFFSGSIKLGEKTTSPYTYAWSNVAIGTYSITAKATDNKGAVSTSAARTVTVNAVNTNKAPVVSLSTPANNASYTAPAIIIITASASDSDGSISKVEFFNGFTKLGEKTTSPYSYSWTGVSAGTYTISAKATDNKGATATSSTRTVTVTNPTTNVCSSLPAYIENGNYVAGSKVKNLNTRYECKPYPYSGWCNGAAWAYAPGTGTYWQDAWTLLGSCNSSAKYASENTTGIELGSVPNPFNDFTNIEFTVPEAGDVTITIYDNTGFKVSVVKEGYLEAGSHRLSFDGSKLKAGLYIIEYKSNEAAFRQKIVKVN